MNPKSLIAGLIFGALGFAGNWFKYELFFNVDFIFGTFFVMLALLRYGPAAGILAGVIASTCTWALWNNPWSIVIFSVEAAVVAWLHEKRRINLTTSMVLYWASLGPLLGWFFFHQTMGIPGGATWLIILKQAINAVMNALLAKFAHLAIATLKPSEKQKPGYREYISTLMLSLVLFPALIYIVIEIRSEIARHLEDARRRSSHTSRLAQTSVDTWVMDNHEHLKALALSVGDPQRMPGVEMQRLAEVFLESAKGTYNRFGVMNRDAVSVAYAPPVDATGKSTIGLNFSDRPYLPIVEGLKMPYVGDVQISRVSPPHPELVLVVPMVPDGTYAGFCGGILDLSPLNSLFREIVGPRNLVITLLDRAGNVITSTDPGREMMKPWPRQGGELRRVSEDVSHLLPAPQTGISIMQRWRNSYFFSETRVSPAIDWTVVVEAPLIPAMTELTAKTNTLFSIMAGIIVLMTGLAHFVSRTQSRPIVALQNLTEQVAAHPEQSVTTAWPASPVSEVEALSRNFRAMAERLRHTIEELNALNQELESRVRERTEETRISEERLRLALGAARQGWYDLNVQTGDVLNSPEYAKLLGYDPLEFTSNLQVWMDNIHPEDKPRVLEVFRACLATGGPASMEYRRRNKAGDWLWLNSTGQVTEYDAEHKPLRMIGIHSDITARKQMEAFLRESEDRFRSLFEKVHVIALVIDPADGSILDANEAACAYYGWPCEHLLSMKITEINTLPPEEVRREMDAARDEKRSYFNFRHCRADGSIRDVEVYSGPIQTRGKALLYSIVHDITERKRAEDRVKELQQEQELILATAPIGILYVKNREILWSNSAFKKTFGYEEEELRGRSTVILYANREQFEEIGREGYAVVAGGVTFSKDFVTIKKDGTRFWVNLIGRAIDPRDVQKGSIWMFQDITERKQSEDELSRREQQYRNLVEHSSVWIWETDENIRHVYTNAMVKDLLGYTVDEFLRTGIFTLVHEEDHEKLRDIADRAIGNREPWRSVVLRWRHRNGSWRHFESSGTPFFAPDGRLLGLRGVDQDVTVRLMAEDALREVNRNLEARVEAETALRLEQERMLVQQSKMAAMGEMIGAIAHQWRQPLNAVGIIAQDVRDAFKSGRLDGPYLHRAVDDTMGQVRFMSKTIEDFRNFFRPDKEQADFDLKQAVAHVLAIVSAQLAASNIRWQVTCHVHGKTFEPGDNVEACGAMVVRGYENELKQVFLNLIDNAKDAIVDHRTGLGDPSVEGLIRIEFDREDGHVVARVSDNGGGIPEHLIDRIFEPYYSTKDQGQGTGIGLYMSKMIIERNMKGKISARNTAEGAEFRVEIKGENA